MELKNRDKNKQKEGEPTLPPRAVRQQKLRNEKMKQPFSKNPVAITLTLAMLAIILTFLYIGFMR